MSNSVEVVEASSKTAADANETKDLIQQLEQRLNLNLDLDKSLLIAGL